MEAPVATPAAAPIPVSEVIVLQPDSPEVTWDVLATIRKVVYGWKLVLAATLICGLLAAAWAYTRKPYFESDAIFLPPARDTEQGGGSFSAFVFGGVDPSDIYLGLLASRSVQDDVINRLDLMRVWHYKHRADAYRSLIGASNFSVSKSSLIDVNVKSVDPVLAADIANAYLEALYRLNGRMAGSSSSHRAQFLEEQLAAQKQSLDQVEQKLARTQVQSGVVSPAGEVAANIGATAQLQAQIDNAEARLAGLLTGATDQNPEVVSERSTIAQLRSQLARQLAGSSGRSNGVASNSQLPGLELQAGDIAREVKLRESVYDALVTQYDKARLMAADPGPEFQVVDTASPAEQKSGPSRRNIMAVGVFLGFFGSLAYLLAADPVRRFVRAIRTPPSSPTVEG
jgi:tyrosine-protein kinase Etk/Wzc